jgi:hypothetical protein
LADAAALVAENAGGSWSAARAAALRRYAHDIRSVIPWTHVADRLRAVGVEVET